MLFSPWDYFHLLRSGQIEFMEVLTTFFSSDHLIIALFKKKIKMGKDDSWRILSGKDLTLDWIEYNLSGATFFSSDNEKFIVNSAEEMNKDVLFSLIDILPRISNKKIVLIFEKSSPVFKHISKVKSDLINNIVISYNWWDGRKLLEFWANQYRILLSYKSLTYLEKALEHTSESFISAFNIIKLAHPSLDEVPHALIEDLVKPSYWDNFMLLSLYANKKRRDFFQKLNELPFDSKLFLSLATLIQSHFVKILDVEDLKKKNKKSRYDRDIISQSKLWNNFEILEQISFWGEFILLAKQSSPSLQNIIRREYLRSFN